MGCTVRQRAIPEACGYPFRVLAAQGVRRRIAPLDAACEVGQLRVGFRGVADDERFLEAFLQQGISAVIVSAGAARALWSNSKGAATRPQTIRNHPSAIASSKLGAPGFFASPAS